MERLVLSAQMQQADRYAIQTLKIPELILMEHAALGVVRELFARFQALLPQTHGLIIAGPGNNGGDALAAARLLYLNDVKDITVVLLNPTQASPSCKAQLEILKKLGVSVSDKIPERDFDWALDGIFGTGLSRPVEGVYKQAIEKLLALHHTWIIAIDIPSGLSADTGKPLGVAVRANQTVTLGFIKQGLLTGEAADLVGEIVLDPIQIPREIPKLEASALWFDREDAKGVLPPRRPTSHKGTFGHVYLFLGVPEKEGASAIAALAALRTGAGLATVIGDPASLDLARPRLPKEIMTEAGSFSFFEKKRGLSCAMGPGLGTTEQEWQVVVSALKSDSNLVLDADALNLIASHQKEALALLKGRKATTILTPHPKEASRLLGNDTADVERDRFASLKALGDKYPCWIVLKGKGTLIGKKGETPVIVTRGNTALSKGGSGDLLTGILVSLLAQQAPPEHAIPLAVYLQGRAAEIVSQRFGSERTSLASDIADALISAMAEIEA